MSRPGSLPSPRPPLPLHEAISLVYILCVPVSADMETEGTSDGETILSVLPISGNGSSWQSLLVQESWKTLLAPSGRQQEQQLSRLPVSRGTQRKLAVSFSRSS